MSELDDLDQITDLFSVDMPTESVETDETITARSVTLELKRKIIKEMKARAAANILRSLPEDGWATHIISNGKFDYFDFCPRIVELIKEPVEEAYFCTWTMNRTNVLMLVDMIKAGKLKKVTFLTGDYFKSRETAVFNTLFTNLHATGNRLRTLKLHAKVMLFRAGERHYVMEGSANFTANPRVEQNFVARSKTLFEHHQTWMEEAFEL